VGPLAVGLSAPSVPTSTSGAQPRATAVLASVRRARLPP